MRSWKKRLNEMRVIGIDPGLRATGYGILEFFKERGKCPSILEAGTIEPNSKEELPVRVNKIYRHLDEIIGEYTPQVMVLEKLYSHYRHPTTACILGHVRGVICLLSAQRHIVLVEHSVKRIRKALIGNGSASKQQTQAAVKDILNIPDQSLALDTSDALALALGHVQMQRKER
jgi:crossover junction endodeoxyribonuclease RuvC